MELAAIIKLLLLIGVLLATSHAWSSLRSNDLSLLKRKATATRTMTMSMDVATLNAKASSMLSVSSAEIDLPLAMEDIVQKAKSSITANQASLAIFFVGTSYESASFDYQLIVKAIRKSFPNIKSLVGCTTGCPIGSLEVDQPPVELESRPGISVCFLSSKAVNFHCFHLSPEELIQYHQDPTSKIISKSDGTKKSSMMLLATDNIKSSLARFCNALQKKENIDSFGAIASTVTMLQSPKLFIASEGSADMEKISSGVVGISMEGDIDVKTYISKSVIPVGPVYKILESDGNTILSMQVHHIE